MENLSFEDRIDLYFRELDSINNSEKQPSIEIQGMYNKSIKVYFDEEIIQVIKKDMHRYKKHLSALRHGYTADKKGINGLRNIHENDGKIYNLASRLLKNKKCLYIIQKYGLESSALSTVKIVAHDPSLMRFYGLLDKNNNKAVILGVGYYK